jgi:hypothetical protein
MFEMKRATIVMTAVVMLCAAPMVAQEKAESDCLKLAFSSVESPKPVDPSGVDNELGTAYTYSAQTTTDLIFNVLFPTTMSGEGVVTLRVTTPRGHHYRQLDVPYSLSASEGGAGTRRIPGYPYPMRVLTPSGLELGRGSYNAIQVLFPVAGTSIVSSSLYGDWQVEGEVSGDNAGCISAAVFEITE